MGPRTPGSTKGAARSLGHLALHSKRAGPVGPSLLGTQGRGQSHRPTWDDSQLCPWPPRKGHPGPTWAQPPARAPAHERPRSLALAPSWGMDTGGTLCSEPLLRPQVGFQQVAPHRSCTRPHLTPPRGSD